MDEPLLRIEDLQKSYAAPVLRGVGFDVRAGEAHALVGANGAGKSTLARILCGLTDVGGGRMTLGGAPYAPASKGEAERAGVHMVMQELNLVGTLSVAENLFLSRLPRRFGFVDVRRLHADARRALAAVGMGHVDVRLPADRLGVGEQQLVEIAAALAKPACRLLILDEPTAALTAPEIDVFFGHVRRLKSEGVGLIYVSHRMEEIRRIADRVTVLRDGLAVATRPTADVSTGEVVRMMVGRQDVRQAADARRREPGAVALRVEGLRRGEKVRGVSFEVRRGEILGFAGLVGAGRTETMRAVYGADRPEAGAVYRGSDVTPLTIRHPADAVRAGIGMVPEDRKRHGLLLVQPVRLNATLARLGEVTRPRGWIDRERERRTSRRLGRAVEVQHASVEQPAAELSGGNQQKVVLARWLLRDGDVLLLDEPTRGIDVGAKRAVYDLLGRLAEEGKAIVVVSSELRELMAVCDRIAVMAAGRITATFERGAWSEDAIMNAALG